MGDSAEVYNQGSVEPRLKKAMRSGLRTKYVGIV